MKKHLGTAVKIAGMLILLAAGTILFKYFHYRSNFELSYIHFDRMDAGPVEIFTAKKFMVPGEPVLFHPSGDSDSCDVFIRSLNSGQAFHTLDSLRVFAPRHISEPGDAENGCFWGNGTPYAQNLQPGYYVAEIRDSFGNLGRDVFLIGSARRKHSVVVIAPVSTWTAYNYFGGKSLYYNAHAQEPVYFASTRRPNHAFCWDSECLTDLDIRLEANIYDWFAKNYDTGLMPDYALEDPGQIPEAEIYVLAYHNEYFSREMYDALETTVNEKGKSLISLGGNQVYWKIDWQHDHSIMECRKDLSNFEHAGMGGKWRHHFRDEADLLGVQYDDRGLGTWAPYKVLLPDHWLFGKTNVGAGELFGLRGMNALPLSGNETDKTISRSKQIEILARGLNPASATDVADPVWQPGVPGWTAAGGGELTLKTLAEGHAVLATGAMQSGAGLGYDSVLTEVVRTFTDSILNINSAARR